MNNQVTVQGIQSQIIQLPNRPAAMLAQNVADLYEVEVKRVNEGVKRNPKRFPGEDFCFQLSKEEINQFWSQSATKIYAGEQKRPWAFTRLGCNMLSTVLQSDIAIERSVQIMRAFSALEELSGNLRQIIREELAAFTPPRKAALPVSKEEASLFKSDILAGLGTAPTARKHGRAKSTIMFYTVAERKAMAARRAN